jgi:hypothetical protein
MALSASVKTLLNKFSESQPALNLPGEPAATSGIKLGDLIAEAIDDSYTPATPANWAGTAPATDKQALDRLAAVVAVLNAGPIP